MDENNEGLSSKDKAVSQAQVTENESAAIAEESAALQREPESIQNVRPPYPKPANRAAAVGKVAAGTVLAAAGVPMLVLPGPGVAAIAAGGMVAAKGVSELTGKENPVISQIESHPGYQSAVHQAQQAKDSVTAAAASAVKQVPGVMGDAGKAIFDVAAQNLPKGVRDAADKVTPVAEGARDAAEKVAPVVKGAVDTAAPAVKGAADAVAPVVKGAVDAAAPAVKAAGEGLKDGAAALVSVAGSFFKKKK